jgi:hypothetical protein
LNSSTVMVFAVAYPPASEAVAIDTHACEIRLARGCRRRPDRRVRTAKHALTVAVRTIERT